MKKQVFYTLLIASSWLCISFLPKNDSAPELTGDDEIDYCAKDVARENAKKALVPFRYSGSKAKRITVKEYNQIATTDVELLYDVPYRLIFNKAGLPDEQKVDIVIFNKPYPKKNRQELWRNSDYGTKEVTFETSELGDYTGDLYIEYVLPAYEGKITPDLRLKGCIVLTLGYNNMVIEQASRD